MPFYYRTKTGIPGLYYSNRGGRKNSGIEALIYLMITGVIICGWIMWLCVKYTYLGTVWFIRTCIDKYENYKENKKGLS